MSNLYAIQNPNLWGGLRHALEIQAVPIQTPLPDFSSLNLVYDVGAGGYANPQWMSFVDSLSINGAAWNWTLGTSTTLNRVGNAPPNLNVARKLLNCVLRLSGGTVTPLVCSIQLYKVGAPTMYQWIDSLTNPGDYTITNYLPAGLLAGGGNELDIRFSVAAGGAGDTAAWSGNLVWAPEGTELP